MERNPVEIAKSVTCRVLEPRKKYDSVTEEETKEVVTMPRGITPTRARRRQSDAKWRASVAMCYEIMKNVIPDHKKLGRRKVSKALTLKETERHIINLETKLKELISHSAPESGKLLMIERDDKILYPATLEDIRQDFAVKQLSFFASTSNGKKRYNVPADIEASLENLSEQVCPLVAIDRADLVAGEITLPTSQEPQQVLKTEQEIDRKGTAGIHKLPAHVIKKERVDDGYCVLQEKNTTPLKNDRSATKSTPGNHSPLKPNAYWTLASRFKGQQDEVENFSSVKYTLPSWNMPSTKTQLYNTPSKSRKKIPCTATSSCCSPGFTPVKLPTSTDLLSLPSTPGKSTVDSAFSPFSLPQTPSSCLRAIDSLEFNDPEDSTSLFCTESIENLEQDDAIVPESTPSWPQKLDGMEEEEEDSRVPVTEMITMDTSSPRMTGTILIGGQTQTKPKREKKCRRRLDQCYPKEVENPNCQDESCLDFDGYYMFYRQHAGHLDEEQDMDEKALTIAKMWENLEKVDRETYTNMACLENSDDSNDLSDDLLEIDLKPFSSPYGEAKENRKSANRSGLIQSSKTLQEVPDLCSPASHSVYRSGKAELQLVPEYEDLGIIYAKEEEVCTETILKQEKSQVVPDMISV